MAASLRAEIERFLTAIEQRRKKTKYKVTAGFGLKRDSNINAGPRDGQVLAAGALFAPLGRAQKQADFAAIGFLSGEVRQDLGRQSRDEFFASATYYQNEQFAIDTQDLHSGSGTFGLKLPFKNFTFTPKFSLTSLRLSREKFFSGYALELRFDRPKTIPAWGIEGYFLGRGTQENFHAIFESNSGLQRTGFRWEWDAGLIKQVNPKHRLEATAKFTRKLPQSFAPNDYRGHKVGLQHTWVLGGGQFLLTSGSYEGKLYKRADPAVTNFQVRHDELLRLGVTYGAPVGMMLDKFNIGQSGYFDGLRDFTWTVTAEITDQAASIRNFSYQNRRIQTMFTRTWNF
jgi:hypothetical protein